MYACVCVFVIIKTYAERDSERMDMRNWNAMQYLQIYVMT